MVVTEEEVCEEAKEESSIVTKHEIWKLSRTSCVFGCFEGSLLQVVHVCDFQAASDVCDLFRE